jgi:hypothetical protein
VAWVEDVPGRCWAPEVRISAGVEEVAGCGGEEGDLSGADEKGEVGVIFEDEGGLVL